MNSHKLGAIYKFKFEEMPLIGVAELKLIIRLFHREMQDFKFYHARIGLCDIEIT